MTENSCTIALRSVRPIYTARLGVASHQIGLLDQGLKEGTKPPAPFGAGFHPYFAVPDGDKARARIPTRATRAFDNVKKQDIAFSGFDLTAQEVDLHLLDHGATEASLTVDDRTVTLRGSPELTHWVVWTLRGRDFVCLEPWTCPGNALNSGDRLIVLGPGETRRTRVEIEES